MMDLQEAELLRLRIENSELVEELEKYRKAMQPEHHRCHKRVNGLLGKLKLAHSKIEGIRVILTQAVKRYEVIDVDTAQRMLEDLK